MAIDDYRPDASSGRAGGLLMKQNFRSLRNYNYRLWALGSLISYIGTWMQRVAQTGWC